jgi:Fe-S-cluster containining protein
MIQSYKELLDWSRINKKQVKQAFKIIRKWKPKIQDAWFEEKHDEAFEKIDCLNCANCCKTTSPIFRDKDIERLSKHFRIKPGQLIADHLHLDGDQDYVLNSAPCPFLDEDNSCSVYDARPNACREYPHTNRKKMVQILTLTETNVDVCPAVSHIIKQLPIPSTVKSPNERM